MLGRTISETKSDGAKERTYVIAAGTVLARQLYLGSTQKVDWEYKDASGLTVRYAGKNSSTPSISSWAEIDAAGNNVGLLAPIVLGPPLGGGLPAPPAMPGYSSPNDPMNSQNLQGSGGCELDGIAVDCAQALQSDSAVQCPDNNCGSRLAIFKSGRTALTFGFSARADGKNGFWYSEEKTSASSVDGGEFGKAEKFRMWKFQEASVSRKQAHKPWKKANLGLLFRAEKKCARDLFGVEVTGGTWSAKGRNGKTNFRVLKGTTVNVYGLFATPAKTFTIYNNVTKYSMNDLAAGGMTYASTNISGKTERGIYGFNIIKTDIASGKRETVTFWTNRTFTANDRENMESDGQKFDGFGLGIDPYIHTQIHETGNSLSVLTGIDLRVKESYNHRINQRAYPHRDSGSAYEMCVLTGYKKLVFEKGK